MTPTKCLVVGASGYTGAELLRLLLRHPGVELAGVTSRQYAGQALTAVFPRFRSIGNADALEFIKPDTAAMAGTGAELAFLALPHGVAVEFAGPLLEAGLRVIDLSADFRLNDPDVYADFYGGEHAAPKLLKDAIYGLPEVYAGEIASARLVASPGCYPTSILLPLIPLLRGKLVDPASIHVASMSGVSGAGKKTDPQLLFVECNESVRPYSVPKHRHLSEIEQELSLAAGTRVAISFTPHLVPVNAGICSTIYAATASGAGEIGNALEEAYAGAPFVRLLGEGGCPDTKNVTGTNFIDIGWVKDKRTGRAVLMSTEDNLGKGAASQALQSFNLMTGRVEGEGLL